LKSIINLGNQHLTGVFPQTISEDPESGPLHLVRCNTNGQDDNCGLVQLMHSFEQEKMYGDNYGYRSGLNQSMVRHLKEVQNLSMSFVSLNKHDLIIDIGSNDGTLLNHYPPEYTNLVGIDPTACKFQKYYRKNIKIIGDFFSSSLVQLHFASKKAKVITSIAMFYDLENPQKFVNEIYESLDDEGIWVFEQSYLKLMLDVNAYDTICHEHIEYYALRQIKWLLDRAKMKIIDVQINDTNGGSFIIVAAKKESKLKQNVKLINQILQEEKEYGLFSDKTYISFKNKIKSHKRKLISLIRSLKKERKTIFGYGASTKGNVILQYCKLTKKEIPMIVEVNEYKFGRITPGTHIPIESEKNILKLKPDYLLVLPWHFKKTILLREQQYLSNGGKLIFPLPEISIVECS